MNLTDEDELFIQRYINSVSDKLRNEYNLNENEINKLLNESVFLDLIKEDPEFVVNYSVNHWANEIYNFKKIIVR